MAGGWGSAAWNNSSVSDWAVPLAHHRTTCVNHLKLELAGASEEYGRKDLYPSLDLGCNAEPSTQEVTTASGHTQGAGEGRRSYLALPKLAWAMVWNWMFTKPLHAISDPDLCGRASLTWHPNLPVLAAVCDESIIVLTEEALKKGGDGRRHEIRGKLSSRFFCVEFRPNSPGDIAAGSNQGLQLFTRSLPQLTRSTLLSHGADEYGMRCLGSGEVDCVSWHPMGQLVACAGPSTSGFMVWDANTCQGSRLGMAMERINLVKWSPCGNYIATASQSRMFYLWETRKWSMKSWSCGKWGNVLSAEWDPHGRFILLAFGKTQKLIVVHITQDPPALDTQWNGMNLEQLNPTSRNTCDALQDDSGCVDSMTWDPTGSRLVVALKAPHPAAGCVAVFDTSTVRGLNPLFIGYARTLPRVAGDSRPGPTSMAFRSRCQKGAMLAVRQGRWVSFLKMLYKQ